jgi:hypothetical protein
LGEEVSEVKRRFYERLGVPVEEKKAQQIVWLRSSTMARVYELAGRVGRAPNVVIAELAEMALEAMERGEWQPSRPGEVKTEVKEIKVYRCPACLLEFPADPKELGLETFTFHVLRDDHFINFLEKWAYQHEGRLQKLEERLKALREGMKAAEGKNKELQMMKAEAGAKP